MSCMLCEGHWKYLGIARSKKDENLFATVRKYATLIFECSTCVSDVTDFKSKLKTELINVLIDNIISNGLWPGSRFSIACIEKEKIAHDQFVRSLIELEKVETYKQMAEFVHTLGAPLDKEQKKSVIITKLRAKLSKTKKRRNNLYDDVKKLSQETVMLQEEISRQKEINNSLNNTLGQVRDHLNSRIQVISAERDDAFSKLSDHEKDCAALKMKVDLLTEQLSEHSIASCRTEEAYSRKLSGAEDEYKRAREAAQMMRADFDHLFVMAIGQKKEIDNLNSTLSAVRDSIM